MEAMVASPEIGWSISIAAITSIKASKLGRFSTGIKSGAAMLIAASLVCLRFSSAARSAAFALSAAIRAKSAALGSRWACFVASCIIASAMSFTGSCDKDFCGGSADGVSALGVE